MTETAHTPAPAPARKRRWGALVLGLVVLAGVVWALWPKGRRLLDRATRITSVSEWDRSQPYFWTNEDQVLFRRPSRHRIVRIYTPHEYAPDDFDIYRHRPSLARSELYQPLTATFRKYFCGAKYEPISVSPDGQWLNAGRGVTCRSDGTGVVVHQDMPDPGNVWMPEGHRLITVECSIAGQYDGRGYGYVYSMNTARPLYSLRHPLDCEASPCTPNADFGRACMTADGYIYAPSAVRPIPPLLYRWKPSKTVPEMGTVPLHMPPDMTLEEISLSSQSNRIAYILTGAPRAPLPSFVYRVFPSLKPQGRIEGLWTSRLDGSDEHELGYVTSGDLQSLEWLPGGQKVSFLYTNALYVAPDR